MQQKHCLPFDFHMDPLCLLVTVFFVTACVWAMSRHEEQRINIQFMTQEGKTPTQIIHSLQAVYRQDALSYPQVRLWHHRFQDGRLSPKDNPRSGCPASHLDSLQDIQTNIQNDRCKTLQEVASDVCRPVSTVFKVIKKDLNMKKLCPKFMPHFLTDANKKMRMNLSVNNLCNVRNIPHYLDRIVSGGETWISLYNQETKFESCQWTEKGGPRPTKRVKSNSIRKTMMILFHDAYRFLLLEFVPAGETIDTDFYCGVLNRLKKRIRCKRPGLWLHDGNGDRNFWIHQDNATPILPMCPLPGLEKMQ